MSEQTAKGILARHQERPRGYGGNGVGGQGTYYAFEHCGRCRTHWPCDAMAMARRVVESEAADAR